MIEPLFGRVIVKPITESQEHSFLTIPFSGYRDRGIVVCPGESKVLNKNDLVVYNIRYAREIRVNDENFLSVDEDQIHCVIKDDS